MRFGIIGGIVGAAVLPIFSTSALFAAAVPPLHIAVAYGASNWQTNPAGTEVGTGDFEYQGLHSIANQWDLQWDVNASPDPFVNGIVSLTNNTASTQNFTLTFTLPVAPPVTPTSLIGGSVSGSISADSSPATLTNVGTDAIYTALIDSSGVATLLNPVTTVTAGSFLSSPIPSASFGTPIPSQPGPAVNTSIGIQLRFSLTAGDSAAFTSVFVANPVPEPGTIMLGVIGTAALLRRSRRR